jgi:predicted O-methyltransferase YrrM
MDTPVPGLDIQGWMFTEELDWLGKQARSHLKILEIGSHHGRSARRIADNTDGALRCVDIWGDEAALTGFKLNLGDHISSGKVIMHRGMAHDILARDFVAMGIKFDWIFIDAAHDYANVSSDIRDSLPLLEPGGILSGHDYYEGWAGVIQAVGELSFGFHRGPGSIWFANP